ncbi:MAG: polysaccharide pyruvyl transferase family protein [Pseudomonadota bacterium]
MPTYAVMSIVHQFLPERYRRFEHLYQAAGQNTGNLLFSTAVWRQLAAERKRVGFRIDPDKINERYDALVIPAANWINPGTDLGMIADSIEKLTIPVVIIGLGAQSVGVDDDPKVPMPAGTERLLRLIAERCHSLSVRGAFTKRVLSAYGIDNVTVTGCPSLYVDFGPTPKPRRAAPFDLTRCLLHGTRYGVQKPDFTALPKSDINRALYRFAFAHALDLLYQSEPEEIALLLGFDDDSAARTPAQEKHLQNVYGATSIDAVEAYVHAHGKVFTGMQVWSKAIRAYQFILGTRLHGTIMALNSGVPASLITHDSRTAEIADFACIPAIDGRTAVLSQATIKDAYERFDMAPYQTRRTQNRKRYHQFLTDNGLVPAFEATEPTRQPRDRATTHAHRH